MAEKPPLPRVPRERVEDVSSHIDIDQIDRNINQSLRRQVSDAIMKNPEMVLSVLRSWKDNDR